MAIEIKLYQFSKKENSTKRPASEDLKGTFQCRLISPTSIVAPSVELSLPATFSVKYVNYAYIQDFDRYYWISGWTYSAGLWIASMTVDALASWKNGIRRSGQYVTRSSDRYNSNITDDLFPATNDTIYGEVGINFENDITQGEFPSLNSGIYVITTISNLSSESGAERNMITYYGLTAGQFANFTEKLMASDFWQQVINGVLDFTKYLLGLRWFPYEPRNLISIGSLRAAVVLGDIPIINSPAYLISRENINIDYNFTFSNIPDHPQKTGYVGKYLNYEPYSSYHIYWPPAGHIPIDGRKITSPDRKLNFRIAVDLRSGDGFYTVSSVDVIGPIAQGSCNISCSIPISANGINFEGLAAGVSGVIAGVAGTVVSAITENWVGVASGVGTIAGGIGNTLKNLLPEYITTGAQGNVTALCTLPKLIYTFHKIVDGTGQFGHPLCEIVMPISSLEAEPGNTAGYMVIPAPLLELDCTPGELAEIKNYMMGGFYLE